MRVRVILNEPFAGISNGWSLRYINLLVELLPHAELHVFAPGQAEALQKALPGAHIYVTGDSQRAPAPKKNLLQFLRSLLNPQADNLQVNGFNFYPSLLELLRQDKQSYDADLLFHISGIVFYGSAANSPLRICDFCDSRIRALRSQMLTAKSLPARLMLKLDILYTRRIKQRLVPKGLKIVAITERDCDEVRNALPGFSVSCVPNGVRSLERDQLEAEIPQRHASRQLIFFGTLNFAPNLDAAQRLLESIWPPVQRDRPDLELRIVGRHPTKGLQALASKTAGVHLDGDVPAIEPFLRSSVLSVCPMFMGAGIKNKILESLAVGLPIVATREAVAGIEFVSGRHGWLAETPAELSRAILDGVRISAEDYRALCLAAHDLALRSSWASAAAPIVDLLKGTAK
ncbi:glycosyltransferase [Steroidobacter sp.]|uniref:glycosyltransferase n=1 Tax=Steroidobacter sp. TaxID=1978227 RepID=UPI001A3BDA05|nr:glycosyltransferase [Steroidobacter sp.]MBL8269756.1 glycosyltransferase [Steroidobacter sp.]